MKTSFVMTIMFILFICFANAQGDIEVKVVEKTMSKGMNTAFEVTIPEAKFKDTEEIWKKYVNSHSFGKKVGQFTTKIGNVFRDSESRKELQNLKVEKKGDEYFVQSVVHDALTSRPMDIYARITQLDEGTQLSAFFQYTDSIFINGENSDAEMMDSFKNYLHDFGVEVYRNEVNQQIKAAESVLKDEEKTLKSYEREVDRLEKSIGRNDVKISEYEANIVNQNAQLKVVDTKTAEQKDLLRTYEKKSADYTTTKDYLKSLKKERNSILSDIKKQKKRILDNKLEIQKYRAEINKLLDNQHTQQSVIEEKQKNVADLETKFEAIK